MQNNISGIIVVNKEKDWTSHDCVAVMRRLVSVKRIGHTGTLDPMAEGVLPICIGTSTRIMEYLDIDYKTYRCEMTLGIETDTQDIWGEVISEKQVEGITKEEILKVCSEFVGDINQIPPKYSALKVNGKKLYEYARSGQEVEIKSRKINIKELTVINIVDNKVTFDVTCSKGTYVRTICKDIGDKLGCLATMSGLTRIRSGIFKIEDSITITELREMTREGILKRLLPPDYPLVHFGKIDLKGNGPKDFINGKKMNLLKRKDEIYILEISNHKEMYKVYYGKTFLGVARIEDNILVADKVFNVRIDNESI
ncbi:MAG: tRNA pseudouridine(55) synthase TruB [Anaerovoracaceae bacterium]